MGHMALHLSNQTNADRNSIVSGLLPKTANDIHEQAHVLAVVALSLRILSHVLDVGFPIADTKIPSRNVLAKIVPSMHGLHIRGFEEF